MPTALGCPNVSQMLSEIGVKNEHIKATGQQQLPTLRRQTASRHSEAVLLTATALPLPFWALQSSSVLCAGDSICLFSSTPTVALGSAVRPPNLHSLFLWLSFHHCKVKLLYEILSPFQFPSHKAIQQVVRKALYYLKPYFPFSQNHWQPHANHNTQGLRSTWRLTQALAPYQLI